MRLTSGSDDPLQVEDKERLARWGIRAITTSSGGQELAPLDASADLAKLIHNLHKNGDLQWEDRALSLMWASYSEEELASADYLVLSGLPSFGLPAPIDGNAVFQCYDRIDVCSKCNAAARQVHPFRLSKKPKLSVPRIVTFMSAQPVFVSTDVFAAVFSEVVGVECMPVLNKDCSSNADYVQLICRNEIDLRVEQRDVCAKCDECGVKRYHGGPLTFFYPPINMKDDVAVARQFCAGSPWVISYPLIISRQIYHRLKEISVKGLNCTPCRPTSWDR